MQIDGQPKRVRLNKDLTKYNHNLKVGQTGTTIPNCKCSICGSYDIFVAVNFDCGVKMDIETRALNY